MSVRRLAEDQPDSFAFTGENAEWAKGEIAKYPEGRQASAVIPLLWQAQAQAGGWLPEPAIRHVGEMLDMAYIRVLEVATFYTMFNLQPVGRHYVQLCGTTPCWLRGADDLKAVCRKVIGAPGHVTEDGAFSWLEVECLGACSNAPMVQINDDFYEDLTAESFTKLLEDLRAGREVKIGSQVGRVSSEPEGGPFTLTDESLYERGNGKASAAGLAETPDAATDTDEAPTTAQARGENVGRPDPTDTPGAAAARTPAGADATPEPDRVPADKATPKPKRAKPAAKPKSEAASATLDSADRPAGLDAPEGEKDDLKRIKGVGPKIEGILNDLGIYHFRQIAGWDRKNVEWVDGYLKFRGRIDRDDWISQAKEFAGEGN